MATACAHPQLSRRYGKHGFERFDHCISQHAGASIGQSSIGKVSVDCRFLFQKSQWGVLSTAQNPAGVVYLDLNIHQPTGCRLKNATITITLDDEDDELSDITAAMRHRRPVQIGNFGPRQIQGQASRIMRTKRSNFTPRFEAGGIAGFGGIGLDSEKQYVQESRWILNGQTSPDTRKKSRNDWVYRVLTWELTENELDSQPTHINTIHTAFSFEHDGQPFFMRVDVAGKLESTRSDIMRWLKFSANPKNNQTATTLINFGGRGRFNKPLDEIAKGLPHAMELENLNDIPVEIPGAHIPSFHQEPLASSALGGVYPETQHRLGVPQLSQNLNDSANQSILHLIEGRLDQTLTGHGVMEPGLSSSHGTTSEAQPPTTTSDLDTLSNMFFILTGPDFAHLQESTAQLTQIAGFQEGGNIGGRHKANGNDMPNGATETQSTLVATPLVTTVGDQEDTIKNSYIKESQLQHPSQETAQKTILMLLRVSGILSLLEMFLALATCITINFQRWGQYWSSMGAEQLERPRYSAPDRIALSTSYKKAALPRYRRKRYYRT